MKTDAQIQKDVLEQIRWNPQLTAAEIGVSVKDGIVTLSGQVDSFLKKKLAEREAKKVSGVRAIAEDIHVGISPSYKKTDAEIAQAVLHALKWHTSIPEDKLQVKVEDQTVMLSGEVEWQYQRDAARSAVIGLVGVRNVINNIRIKQTSTSLDIRKKITEAYQRSATVDAEKVEVTVFDSKAILKGKVRSIAEKEAAEEVAWAAPGIFHVENALEVEKEPSYSF